MPTYTYRCVLCDDQLDHVMSMREYTDHPPSFFHCGNRMERVLAPVHLATVSERSYTDLRASDGTDISTRAKHREYMRRNNLTTVDDFRSTWKNQAVAREQLVNGADPQRVHDIARAIEKLGG